MAYVYDGRGQISRRFYFSPEFRIEGEWPKALFAIGLQSFISCAGVLWLVDHGAHDARNPALPERENATFALWASEH